MKGMKERKDFCKAHNLKKKSKDKKEVIQPVLRREIYQIMRRIGKKRDMLEDSWKDITA